MTSTLYNLDVPDEQLELGLKDASRDEIIESTYKAWLDGYRALLDKDPKIAIDHNGAEMLYQGACRMLRPFANRIAGRFDADELPVPKKGELRAARLATGSYLAALVNETCLERLDVTKGDVMEIILLGHADYKKVTMSDDVQGRRGYVKRGYI
jgi:hypothetical protein